jgi:hypothetical protein
MPYPSVRVALQFTARILPRQFLQSLTAIDTIVISSQASYDSHPSRPAVPSSDEPLLLRHHLGYMVRYDTLLAAVTPSTRLLRGDGSSLFVDTFLYFHGISIDLYT